MPQSLSRLHHLYDSRCAAADSGQQIACSVPPHSKQEGYKLSYRDLKQKSQKLALGLALLHRSKFKDDSEKTEKSDTDSESQFPIDTDPESILSSWQLSMKRINEQTGKTHEGNSDSDSSSIASPDPSSGVTAFISVEVSRLSPFFLPALVAISRVGATALFPAIPAVPMDSKDSQLSAKEKAKIKARNAQVDELKGFAITEEWCERVLDEHSGVNVSDSDCESALSMVEEELDKSQSQTNSEASDSDSNYPPIAALMFTGGTTGKEKLAAVSHSMFVHEFLTYEKMTKAVSDSSLEGVKAAAAALPLSVCDKMSMSHSVTTGLESNNKVLCNTSLLWAASTLGQLNIALSLGAEVVFTETYGDNDLERTLIKENNVNIIGVAPTVLDGLCPESKRNTKSSNGPGTSATASSNSDSCKQHLPTVDLIFTWGEKLKRTLAERFTGENGIPIRELLIATEYWLCLWSDPHEVVNSNASSAAFSSMRTACSGLDIVITENQTGTESDDPDSAEPTVRPVSFFRPEDLQYANSSVTIGKTGTLHLRGDFVSPGYYNPESGNINKLERVEVDGKTYFCTQDHIEVVSGIESEFLTLNLVTVKIFVC